MKLDQSVLATMLRERYENSEISRSEYDAAMEDLSLVIRNARKGS